MSLRIIDLDDSYTVDESTGKITLTNNDGSTTIVQFNQATGLYETSRGTSSSSEGQFGQAALSEGLKLISDNDKVVNSAAVLVDAVRGDSVQQMFMTDFAKSLQANADAISRAGNDYAAQGQLWKSLADGMENNRSGMAQHLDARGQEMLDMAIRSSRNAQQYSEAAQLANSAAGAIDARYANFGAVMDAVTLLSALSDGDTGAVAKATFGVAAGVLAGIALGAAGAPVMVGLVAGILVGMAADAIYDEYLADTFKDRGNFWDNLFDSLGLDPTGGAAGSAQDSFGDAERLASPLILDLDGDGVETRSVANGVNFDHDGNGFAEATGWVGKDDGLLVLDVNGNGQIDTGAELFGNHSRLTDGTAAANGFLALADWDQNNDGRIDASDAAYSQLRVWKDINGNGKADAGELLTLQDTGVASINTGFINTDLVDANGNHHLQTGSFTRTDGSLGEVSDVWFKVDYAESQEVVVDGGGVTGNATIDALPQIAGTGNVSNLRSAMLADATLKGLVESYSAAGDRAAREALVDQIIFRWAGVDGRAPGSRGSNLADGRILYALEAFLGESYQQGSSWGSNPGPQAAGVLRGAYDEIRQAVSAQLLMQTHMRPWMDLITVGTDGGFTYDFTALSASLQQLYASEPGRALGVAMDLGVMLETLLGGTQASILGAIEAQGGVGVPELDVVLQSGQLLTPLSGTASNDVLTSGNADTLLLGMGGNDQLTGGNGDDLLAGGQGDDVLDGGNGLNRLYGGAGNDTLRVAANSRNNILHGGTGDDVMTGGNYADTYLFNLGDGQDTILENTAYSTLSATYDDTVRFGAGIAATDVVATMQGSDLVLEIGSGGDSLRIKDWRLSNGDQNWRARIERFEFADGTVLTHAGLVALGITTRGTDGDDVLVGWAGNDNMLGGAGDDTLEGGEGNDILDGAEGNDTLNGGGGSNTLYGGSGDDTLHVNAVARGSVLHGGTGSDTMTGSDYADTYLFNVGDGHDTVIESSAYSTVSSTYNDTIRFGAGISADAVTVIKEGNDLLLEIGSGVDAIRLKDWLLSNGEQNWRARIERFEFADGTVWTHGDLVARGAITRGTEVDDALDGWAGVDHMLGGAGNDILRSGSGNDVLEGGDGNDVLNGGTGSNTLYGGAGDDSLLVATEARDNTLHGGTGNDTLSGGDYADTYVFNRGDGQDTIVENTGYSTLSSIYNDTVKFGDSINAADIVVVKQGVDLVLEIAGTGDALRLKNWLLPNGVQNWRAMIESFQFADGTVWSHADLLAKGVITRGTDDDDVLVGSTGHDHIQGGKGNDTLTGGAGNDTLQGGEGDDILDGGIGSNVLRGEEGNDTLRVADDARESTLHGGVGDDAMAGSYYADTYLFNIGDGHDTLIESTTYSTESATYNDTVSFGEGITEGSVVVLKDGNDLILEINGTDSLRLKDWLLANGEQNWKAKIERFTFVDGTEWTHNDLVTRGAITRGTDGGDALDGWVGNDHMLGGAGDDILNGGAGNDLLEGGEGNDTLYGGSGTNTLYGGAGNDTLAVSANARDSVLHGGVGNDTLTGSDYTDTYLFNLGDGQDTIIENTAYSTESATYSDKVVFGVGIASADITVVKDGDDLVLEVGTGGDALRLKNWLLTSGEQNWKAKIETFHFADGSTWTHSDLLAQGLITRGTDADDTLVGSTGHDHMLGGKGRDTLEGGIGNDTLDGGEGDDVLDGGLGTNVLLGGGGDDTLRVSSDARGSTLHGGAGSDTLAGSYYADTFVFNLGDGHDTIIESTVHSTESSIYNDTVRFGEGITADDITVVKEGSDLVLEVRGDSDTLRIQNWLQADGAQNWKAKIERFQFADGSTWTHNDLVAKGAISRGTDAADTLTGWAGNDRMLGGAGDDILKGAAGNDVLEGGSGNDLLDGGSGTNELYGGEGDDTLLVSTDARGSTLHGGTGNDTQSGSSYADTYLFNVGDGHDTIIENTVYTTDSSIYNDIVRFGAGITAADITVVKENNDLVLEVAGSSDTLRLKNWLQSNGEQNWKARIESLQFADDTRWSHADLVARGAISRGTDADDVLTGWAGNDHLVGGKGNDTLNGGFGNDTLDGGDGNDALNGGGGTNALYGGAGDDSLAVSTDSRGNTLHGGKGTDTLAGSYFADTYLFNAGDGHDAIVENTSYSTNSATYNDTLRFGEGITADAITFNREGVDLVLDVAGGGADSVRIRGWYTADGAQNWKAQIETIAFDDGSSWGTAAIRTRGLAAPSRNSTATGLDVDAVRVPAAQGMMEETRLLIQTMSQRASMSASFDLMGDERDAVGPTLLVSSAFENRLR
ncbi:beta strand repeat-containing protein [Stenotrophomonas indicatrix]|uniref:beta strand repeat-containing protein n=1 Tax=Stenotrophomonas indicatrix TaxID=2045451 RepID=UPI002002ACD3|nr:calcium-binding protein [Stenotrophomonas indicatrix]